MFLLLSWQNSDLQNVTGFKLWCNKLEEILIDTSASSRPDVQPLVCRAQKCDTLRE